MERRIAVIVPGGVGSAEWIPSLVQVLHRLSTRHRLAIYSYSRCTPHPLLTGDGIALTTPPMWCLGLRPLTFLYFYVKIQLDHRRHPFILLHSYWIFPSGLTALAVNVSLRIRSVLSLPGGDTVRLPSIEYGGMRSEVHRRLVRRCCAAADAVVVLTEYQKTKALENGIHLQHARVIPYGVDTGQFSFKPLPFSPPLRLISIGSLNRVKNIFLQIDAYAILCRSTECLFTIVGEDTMLCAAQRYAESLHVAHLIQWKGQCTHEEIPGLLHGAHMLVHTAFYEAEGVVLMEAFAAGTVVIGTRVGLLSRQDVARECILDDNDPVHLAAKILTLFGDVPGAERVRNENRHYAERTSIDWTADAYSSLYEELISTGGPLRGEGAVRPG
jgi:glycosyltransferase involved in cell wall biosynthesis